MSHFISAFLLLFSLNISHSYGIELFSKAFDEDSEFRWEVMMYEKEYRFLKSRKTIKGCFLQVEL